MMLPEPPVRVEASGASSPGEDEPKALCILVEDAHDVSGPISAVLLKIALLKCALCEPELNVHAVVSTARRIASVDGPGIGSALKRLRCATCSETPARTRSAYPAPISGKTRTSTSRLGLRHAQEPLRFCVCHG